MSTFGVKGLTLALIAEILDGIECAGSSSIRTLALDRWKAIGLGKLMEQAVLGESSKFKESKFPAGGELPRMETSRERGGLL